MDQEEGRGSTIWWLEMCNNYSEKFAFLVSEICVLGEWNLCWISSGFRLFYAQLLKHSSTILCCLEWPVNSEHYRSRFHIMFPSNNSDMGSMFYTVVWSSFPPIMFVWQTIHTQQVVIQYHQHLENGMFYCEETSELYMYI